MSPPSGGEGARDAVRRRPPLLALVLLSSLLLPSLLLPSLPPAAWVPPSALAQPAPDLGPLGDAVDGVVGGVVAPAVQGLGNATGQNLSREDVRMQLDLNFTKGNVGLLGLLVGSGQAEIQADCRLRVEMRVISSDRLRAAAEEENAYNMSAENATALSQVFLTSEMFRATLTAEAVAAFQEQQEAAIREYLEGSVPELEVVGLAVTWTNTTPTQAVRDLSLTEPPIVMEIDATVQYVRTESVRSLVASYLDRRERPEDPKRAYVRDLKEENGSPLRARDFFAAAAYTQLLNLSMQPGWSLDVSLHLPRGYSFTYFNDNVDLVSEREAHLRIDAAAAEEDVREVVLASITHKRGVALVLFVLLLAVGLALQALLRATYGRRRLVAWARPGPPRAP